MHRIPSPDHSPDGPTPITLGGTLVAYLLIGGILVGLWATSSPVVAASLVLGVAVGTLGTVVLLGIVVRVRRRSICLPHMDVCLTPYS